MWAACSGQVQKDLVQHADKALGQAVLWWTWNPRLKPCSKSSREKLWTACAILGACSTRTAVTSASPVRAGQGPWIPYWCRARSQDTWESIRRNGRGHWEAQCCHQSVFQSLWLGALLNREADGAFLMCSSSRLGLIRRVWEGCSSGWSAVPRPTAVPHFHPHAAASGSVLVPLSRTAETGSVLCGQHTCVCGRARLAWLRQQNCTGGTVFQTVTNVSREGNLTVRGGLSAEWPDAFGAVGAAVNKLCGHHWCRMSLHWS